VCVRYLLQIGSQWPCPSFGQTLHQEYRDYYTGPVSHYTDNLLPYFRWCWCWLLKYYHICLKCLLIYSSSKKLQALLIFEIVSYATFIAKLVELRTLNSMVRGWSLTMRHLNTFYVMTNTCTFMWWLILDIAQCLLFICPSHLTHVRKQSVICIVKRSFL